MSQNSQYSYCIGTVYLNWLQMQKPKSYHNRIFKDKYINVLGDYGEEQLHYTSVE